MPLARFEASGKRGFTKLTYWCKVHRHGKNVVVAICDADLLGKTLQDQGLKISVSEKFYGGFKASLSEALKLLEDATTANLLGESIVAAAIDAGFIHRDAVTRIASIPHAILVKIAIEE